MSRFSRANRDNFFGDGATPIRPVATPPQPAAPRPASPFQPSEPFTRLSPGDTTGGRAAAGAEPAQPASSQEELRQAPAPRHAPSFSAETRYSPFAQSPGKTTPPRDEAWRSSPPVFSPPPASSPSEDAVHAWRAPGETVRPAAWEAFVEEERAAQHFERQRAAPEAAPDNPALEAGKSPEPRWDASFPSAEEPAAPVPSLSKLQSEFAAAAFALPDPDPEPAPAPATAFPAPAPSGEARPEARPGERNLFALVPYAPRQARNLGSLLATLRAKAAEANPDLAIKLMSLIGEQSSRSLNASARFAARSARKLAKAGQEIAHNLRGSELKRNYQRVLAFAHARLIDRKLDTLLFIPTSVPGRQLALTTGSRVPAAAYEGPTPQLVYEWALAPLPQDLREYAFVDFRAGRGRSLLLAARRNFEKIVGYEYDETSFDALSMNVAQYPRSLMTCRNVHCIRGDREGISIPDQPAVLFFSNAHREGQLSVALNHAMASHHRNPRSLYVILINPGATLPEGFDEVFALMPQPLLDRVKFALLSPVKVAVYHSRQ